MIMGFAVWVIMVSCAMLLRRDPEQMGLRAYGVEALLPELNAGVAGEIRRDGSDATRFLLAAIRTKALWLLIATFFMFIFCVQVIMVHLVNYATDTGVTPSVAATIISVIGIGSLVGRLSMGIAADRIGSKNALIACCLVLPISLLWLIFVKQIWMLYIFAICFGLSYGGDVPQIPSLVAYFFGLRAASVLMGAVSLGGVLGGAVGSWVAGQLFDMTQGYQVVFIISGVAAIITFILALILNRGLPHQESAQY
jgi:MFS family permease